jgi:hypothetical protein
MGKHGKDADSSRPYIVSGVSADVDIPSDEQVTTDTEQIDESAKGNIWKWNANMTPRRPR